MVPSCKVPGPQNELATHQGVEAAFTYMQLEWAPAPSLWLPQAEVKKTRLTDSDKHQLIISETSVKHPCDISWTSIERLLDISYKMTKTSINHLLNMR